MLLMTITEAREQVGQYIKEQRVRFGYTQKSLADRSGVNLATLRKFEQTGVISLESLLKIFKVLQLISNFEKAIKPSEAEYSSIEDYEARKKVKKRERGWRK